MWGGFEEVNAGYQWVITVPCDVTVGSGSFLKTGASKSSKDELFLFRGVH